MAELYISTTEDRLSGEWVEMAQLAEAAGAELVSDVPPTGLLIYMSNVNFRHGAQHFRALAERSGPTAIIIGICRSQEEAPLFARYFDTIRQLGQIHFVHHPGQVEYLEQYGIDAVLKPICERELEPIREGEIEPIRDGEIEPIREGEIEPIREGGLERSARWTPKTIVYTGFYWSEKNLPFMLEVARLLPSWRFTIQVGTPLTVDAEIPNNVTIHNAFVPQERYLEYLAGFEYVWIPRTESPNLYAGRSGLSAVASRRPALLTDVTPNAIVPAAAAIKYPAEASAEEVADLIRSRPTPEADAVEQFLLKHRPDKVWEFMLEAFASRGIPIPAPAKKHEGPCGTEP